MKVEKDPGVTFPYFCTVFPGNNAEAIAKILRPRGFVRINSNDDIISDSVDFVWKQTQYSQKVLIIFY